MASKSTMDYAIGKMRGGKSDPQDDEDDAPESEAGGEDDEKEEPDDAKTAFVDMCKAIKAGNFDEAWDLWQDCKDMG